MNYTETFDQFASRVTPTDLALYAGAGIILWVLLKEKLCTAQKVLMDLVTKAKGLLGKKIDALPVVNVPATTSPSTNENVFLALIVSWKQTRDLAVTSGCTEAVRVADEMFPYLSPNVCANKKDTKDE